MSTLRVNTLQTTSGVEVYTCKAWVNFNGTGTVAIRASGNVSSITDRGVGQYTVNLTTALPDTNGCAVAGFTQNPSGTYTNYESTSLTSTSSCDVDVGIVTGSSSIAIRDSATVQVAIFR